MVWYMKDLPPPVPWTIRSGFVGFCVVLVLSIRRMVERISLWKGRGWYPRHSDIQSFIISTQAVVLFVFVNDI